MARAAIRQASGSGRGHRDAVRSLGEGGRSGPGPLSGSGGGAGSSVRRRSACASPWSSASSSVFFWKAWSSRSPTAWSSSTSPAASCTSRDRSWIRGRRAGVFPRRPPRTARDVCRGTWCVACARRRRTLEPGADAPVRPRSGSVPKPGTRVYRVTARPSWDRARRRVLARRERRDSAASHRLRLLRPHARGDAGARAGRARNLAALGQMAATVAHELRNPLGAIQGFAGLLSRDLAGAAGRCGSGRAHPARGGRAPTGS